MNDVSAPIQMTINGTVTWVIMPDENKCTTAGEHPCPKATQGRSFSSTNLVDWTRCGGSVARPC